MPGELLPSSSSPFSSPVFIPSPDLFSLSLLFLSFRPLRSSFPFLFYLSPAPLFFFSFLISRLYSLALSPSSSNLPPLPHPNLQPLPLFLFFPSMVIVSVDGCCFKSHQLSLSFFFSFCFLLETKCFLQQLGLRVGVTKGGCSGKSFDLSYAYDFKPHEELVKDKGTSGAPAGE